MNISILRNLGVNFENAKNTKEYKQCIAVFGNKKSGKSALSNLLAGHELKLKIDQTTEESQLIVQKKRDYGVEQPTAYPQNLISEEQFIFPKLYYNTSPNVLIVDGILLESYYYKQFIYEGLILKNCLKKCSNISFVITVSNYEVETNKLLSIIQQFEEILGNQKLKIIAKNTTLVVSRCQKNTIDEIKQQLAAIIELNNAQEGIIMLLKSFLENQNRIIAFQARDYKTSQNILKDIVQNSIDTTKISPLLLLPKSSYKQNQFKEMTKSLINDSNLVFKQLCSIIRIISSFVSYYKADDDKQRIQIKRTILEQLNQLQLQNKPKFQTTKVQLSKYPSLINKQLKTWDQFKNFLSEITNYFCQFQNKELFNVLILRIKLTIEILQFIQQSLCRQKLDQKHREKIQTLCDNILLGATWSSESDQLAIFKHQIQLQNLPGKIELCFQKIREKENDQIRFFAIKVLIKQMYRVEMFQECILCVIYCFNYIQIERLLKEGVNAKRITKIFLKKLFKNLKNLNQFDLAITTLNYIIPMIKNRQEYLKYSQIKMVQIVQKKQKKNIKVVQSIDKVFPLDKIQVKKKIQNYFDSKK